MAWCLCVGTYIYAEMGRGEREEGKGGGCCEMAVGEGPREGDGGLLRELYFSQLSGEVSCSNLS